MNIFTRKRRSLAGGSGIIDHAMTAIQIVGMAITVIALKHFTPLPFWACCLIGLPLSIGLFLGTLHFLSRGRR
jgi:hypothetical protein